MNTSLNRHWVIDNNLFTDETQAIDKTVIEGTLQNKIEKRLNELKSLSTKNEDYNDPSNRQDSIAFELPSYKKDYSIIENIKSFVRSQRWVGHITAIHDEYFEAKLTDITNPTTYEIGEFDLSDISSGDKELISIGAAFYWSIGRAVTNGQVENKSLIRFQRVVPWNVSALNKVVDRAEDVFENLNWE